MTAQSSSERAQLSDEQIEELCEQFIDYGDGDTEGTVIDALGFARAVIAADRTLLAASMGGEKS